MARSRLLRLRAAVVLLAELAGAALDPSLLATQRWVNFNGDGSAVTVTWTSSSTTDAVQWSLTSGGPYTPAEGDVVLSTYSTPPSKKNPAYVSGLIHHQSISSLPLGARIFYVIGDPSIQLQNNESSFLNHPGVGPTVVTRMLVLADLDYLCLDGKACGAVPVLSSLLDTGLLDGVNGGGILCGDLSYADGNQSHWDGWQAFYDPLSSRVSLAVSEGNHEDKEFSAAIPYRTRFGAMPFASPLYDSTGPLFYSYDIGSAHVIVLSAYGGLLAPASAQTAFLTADLAAVNRSTTPWLLVVTHPTLYNSNTDHMGDGDEFLAAYEETLYAHRVNVVVTGHVHAYQRTSLVFNGTAAPDASGAGIYHIMVGTGGKDLAQMWQDASFPWLVERDVTFFGPGFFTFHNATHADFDIHCASGVWPNGTAYMCDARIPRYSATLLNQLYTNPVVPATIPTPTPSPIPGGFTPVLIGTAAAAAALAGALALVLVRTRGAGLLSARSPGHRGRKPSSVGYQMPSFGMVAGRPESQRLVGIDGGYSSTMSDI